LLLALLWLDSARATIAQLKPAKNCTRATAPAATEQQTRIVQHPCMHIAKENAVCSFVLKENEQTAFSFACAYKDVELFGLFVM